MPRKSKEDYSYKANRVSEDELVKIKRLQQNMKKEREDIKNLKEKNHKYIISKFIDHLKYLAENSRISSKALKLRFGKDVTMDGVQVFRNWHEMTDLLSEGDNFSLTDNFLDDTVTVRLVTSEEPKDLFDYKTEYELLKAHVESSPDGKLYFEAKKDWENKQKLTNYFLPLPFFPALLLDAVCLPDLPADFPFIFARKSFILFD